MVDHVGTAAPSTSLRAGNFGLSTFDYRGRICGPHGGV
jgi:hypothetical protein